MTNQKVSVNKALCCDDIYNPALLGRARPGEKPAASPWHTRVAYHDEAFEPELKAIRQWRSDTHKGSDFTSQSRPGHSCLLSI